MHASSRQLTRQEVQKLAKDLPRLCLQVPAPTHTVMSMALEITTLLAERDEARGEAESERLRLEILTDYPYKGEPFSWLRATPTEGAQ